MFDGKRIFPVDFPPLRIDCNVFTLTIVVCSEVEFVASNPNSVKIRSKSHVKDRLGPICIKYFKIRIMLFLKITVVTTVTSNPVL